MHIDTSQYGMIRQFQRSDIDRILEIAGNSLTEYNVLSNLIAQDVVKEHGDDVQEVHVRIVSQIGRRIDDPQ